VDATTDCTNASSDAPHAYMYTDSASYTSCGAAASARVIDGIDAR
jgi:hypothetical protein